MGLALEVPCSDALSVLKVHEGFDLSEGRPSQMGRPRLPSAQSARRGQRARRCHRPAVAGQREPAGRTAATHPDGLHVIRKVRPGGGHQLLASLTS
jgi:hypothetical protein